MQVQELQEESQYKAQAHAEVWLCKYIYICVYFIKPLKCHICYTNSCFLFYTHPYFCLLRLPDKAIGLIWVGVQKGWKCYYNSFHLTEICSCHCLCKFAGIRLTNMLPHPRSRWQQWSLLQDLLWNICTFKVLSKAILVKCRQLMPAIKFCIFWNVPLLCPARFHRWVHTVVKSDLFLEW